MHKRSDASNSRVIAVAASLGGAPAGQPDGDVTGGTRYFKICKSLNCDYAWTLFLFKTFKSLKGTTAMSCWPAEAVRREQPSQERNAAT